MFTLSSSSRSSIGDPFKLTRPADPRVVNEDVNASESVKPGIDQRTRLRTARDVRPHSDRSSAFAFDRPHEALGRFPVRDEVDDYRGPLLREPHSDGLPDAAGRTCDDRDLPLQLAWHYDIVRFRYPSICTAARSCVRRFSRIVPSFSRIVPSLPSCGTPRVSRQPTVLHELILKDVHLRAEGV